MENPEEKLRQLSAELEFWRREAGGRGLRVPEEFWARACELVPEVSPSRTANVLRLSYKGLKKRLGLDSQELVARERRLTESPAFLEWLTPPSVGLRRCTVKVEGANGSRMLLELEGADIAGVSCLIKDFSL